MMTEQPTLVTEQVKVMFTGSHPEMYRPDEARRAAEFDAWLAEHDRDVLRAVREKVSAEYASMVPSAEWGLAKLKFRQFGKWLDARIEGRAPIGTPQ